MTTLIFCTLSTAGYLGQQQVNYWNSLHKNKVLLSIIYIQSTCYFDVHVVVKQKIFSLQVTVNNLSTVAILHC